MEKKVYDKYDGSLYRKYDKPDEFVILNQEDKDITPIRVNILKDIINPTYKQFGKKPPDRFPENRYIAGYGLEPEDQKFQREEYPDKLKKLEIEIRSRPKKSRDTFIRREIDTIQMFWEMLNKYQDKYAEEILWLRKQWYYRLFGYWFFCNGKPTHLTGPDWYFLNYWYLDAILPEYRDRDRRWWMAQKFSELDTKTFRHRDKKGRGIPDENGNYEMIDTGRRVCFGTNNPKARRVGDTSKAQCDHTEYATRTNDAYIGIQGMGDTNAGRVFYNHFNKPFKKLPIFFKPLFEQLDPKNEQIFNNDDPLIGLGTAVDFATSSDRSAYDGSKLHRYHKDEPGKDKLEDISKSHIVVKRCLSLGDKINGVMKYTTTVDEMNRRGGEKFLKLTKTAHWDKRNKNGQTASGLYNIFFRASDGKEGFIGPYGESVEFNPTKKQAKFIGKDIGAREWIMNEREDAKMSGDIELLSQLKRLDPITFRECFTPPAANVFFRNDILEQRIQDLQFSEDAVRIGDFDWEKGRFSTVRWFDDEDGPFRMSKVFKPGDTNQFMKVDGIFTPMFPDRGILGADAFRLEKTDGGRMSDGGIAGFQKRDVNIDSDDIDIKKWLSHRFILTYLHRPDTTEEFAEAVLKAAIFTGYMVYPENNVDVIQRNFINWGYEGYLLYDTDPVTGNFKNNPGWYTTEQAKIKIFNRWRDYIRHHAHRDRHADILLQCLEIPNRDKMTDFDLFTAGGGCLIGLDSQQGNYLMEQQNVHDVDWLPEYDY